MSSLIRFRNDQRLPRPEQFYPDETFSTGGYTYALDHGQGVGCRIAASRSVEPTVYFRLEPVIARAEPNTPPVPPARQRSKRRYRGLRRVLTGIAVAAAVLLVYPYYPALQYQTGQGLQSLSQPAQAATVATVPLTSNNQLTIPAIGVQTPILEAPTIDVLLKHEGVWHQTGALPSGSLTLAGHRFRYLPPNTSTFYNLGKLQSGDPIYVNWYGRQYEYLVSTVTTISNTDTSFLLNQAPAHLYLYTCQDWLMTQRILVMATLLP